VLRNTAVAEEIRDSPDPAPEKIRRVVTGLLSSYAEHYPLLYLYLEENLSHVAKSREAWAAEMRSVNRRYLAAIEGMISDGIAQGTLRPLADPRILANGLMGLVSWTHRWFNPRRSATDAVTIGTTYADLLLGGMEGRGRAAGCRPVLAGDGASGRRTGQRATRGRRRSALPHARRVPGPRAARRRRSPAGAGDPGGAGA
jgi:hypothetical protein